MPHCFNIEQISIHPTYINSFVKIVTIILLYTLHRTVPVIFSDTTVQQNETFFLLRNIYWGDSCRVYRPEHESANRLSLSPSVFEKLNFEKKLQIFNFEHLLCRNDNSFLVARCVRLFYEPSRIQKYKLLLHYEDLNMFKQRSKGKGYLKCTHYCRYLPNYFQN